MPNPESIHRRLSRPRRALVPDCGSGWEARYLADLGWDVTALDFSAKAIAVASLNLGSHADRLVDADQFNFDVSEAFDVVYHTHVAAVCNPRGRSASTWRLLAGFFFFTDEANGPPFGTSHVAVADLLDPRFARERDREVDDSIPLFDTGSAGRNDAQHARMRDGNHGPTPKSPGSDVTFRFVSNSSDLVSRTRVARRPMR